MFIFWSYWSTNKTVNKNQAVMNPIKKEKTATPTIIGIVRRDDWSSWIWLIFDIERWFIYCWLLFICDCLRTDGCSSIMGMLFNFIWYLSSGSMILIFNICLLVVYGISLSLIFSSVICPHDTSNACSLVISLSLLNADVSLLNGCLRMIPFSSLIMTLIVWSFSIISWKGLTS